MEHPLEILRPAEGFRSLESLYGNGGLASSVSALDSASLLCGRELGVTEREFSGEILLAPASRGSAVCGESLVEPLWLNRLLFGVS